jgi:Mg-chelatase subunit ChlD
MNRLVMDVPRWPVWVNRQARDLPAAAPNDGADLQFGDEVFARLYDGNDPPALEADKKNSDFGAWADEAHGALSQNPDFARLADSCRGDALAAAVAADSLTANMKPTAKAKAEPPKPGQRPPPTPRGQGTALGRAKAGGDAQDQARKAVARAVANAEAAVAEAREAADGLAGLAGWDLSDPQGGAHDAENVKALLKALRGNPALKRIAEIAGRMKRIAASKRRSKTIHGAEQVTDVEQGGELARLLPVETAKLMHPLMKLSLMRDLTERKALQYRMEGKEEQGRGPVVLLVDKSGSMAGDRDIWATALALAVMSEAHHDRRAFALIPYTTHPGQPFIVQPGENLPLECLSIPASGGTDIAPAVKKGIDLIAGAKDDLQKADIILVSDGGADTVQAAGLRAEAAALGITIHGLGIGTPRETMTPWCDTVTSIEDLGTLDDKAASDLFGGGE